MGGALICTITLGEIIAIQGETRAYIYIYIYIYIYSESERERRGVKLYVW